MNKMADAYPHCLDAQRLLLAHPTEAQCARARHPSQVTILAQWSCWKLSAKFAVCSVACLCSFSSFLVCIVQVAMNEVCKPECLYHSLFIFETECLAESGARQAWPVSCWDPPASVSQHSMPPHTNFFAVG